MWPRDIDERASSYTLAPKEHVLALDVSSVSLFVFLNCFVIPRFYVAFFLAKDDPQNSLNSAVFISSDP